MSTHSTRPPDDPDTDQHPVTDAGAGPMLCFLLVLLGGYTLIGGIDHLHHLGAAVGTTCFIAVPFFAAIAAAALRHPRTSQ